MSKINIPLDIKSLEIIDQTIDNKGNIILEVVSKGTNSTCHKCKKSATKRNGTAPIRLIRHLPILDTPVYIKITPIRYSCDYCNDHPTTTEQYDWCERNATTTNALEEYLMRSLINTTIEDVSRKENISPEMVQGAVDRHINQEVDWVKISNLETLGIDEIALRKGQNSYITIISSKVENSQSVVIAVLDGRSKETVQSFLENIPAYLKQTVKQVCTDMYDGYVNAALEVFGPQALVIDRYHVAKLYRKPLDQLRIKEMESLKIKLSAEDYARLDGMMWILRKKHECLSEADKGSLAFLYQHSALLKKAHSMALKLTHIFNTHISRKSALARIDRWIRAVAKSGLTIFNKFIETLKKYKPYIGNYFKSRKNSGFVEGLNNKIKVLKRRCYGLFKPETIFQRLFLDLQGYTMFA